MASKTETKEQPEPQISAEIGEYLSSQYGVLVKILKCLTAKDLKNASKVCRSWESAAKKLVAAQTKLKWLFYRRDRGWNVSPQLATWTAICEHIYFDPDICLCFISKKCLKEKLKCNCSDVPCPVSRDIPCNGTHSFADYLDSFLEPGCRSLVYPVSGVVSTDQDLSKTWEVDYYESKKGSSAMSLLFLPRMKGVTAIAFSLSHEQRMSLYQGGGKNVDIVTLLGLPENEAVQAVLIFSGTAVNQRCTSVLVGKLQERQKQRVAAGGALMDKPDCFEGIVFCGPNVCAASIVLTENICEKDQVKEQVARLKNCSLPTENSVAFMFACLARGSAWYENEPNVESHFINQAFPTTPVVGFFGSGEMGVTSLPDVSTEMLQGSRHFWKFWEQVSRIDEKSDDTGVADGEPPRKIAHKSDFSYFLSPNYSYSTSIVLLSFNTAT